MRREVRREEERVDWGRAGLMGSGARGGELGLLCIR